MLPPSSFFTFLFTFLNSVCIFLTFYFSKFLLAALCATNALRVFQQALLPLFRVGFCPCRFLSTALWCFFCPSAYPSFFFRAPIPATYSASFIRLCPFANKISCPYSFLYRPELLKRVGGTPLPFRGLAKVDGPPILLDFLKSFFLPIVLPNGPFASFCASFPRVEPTSLERIRSSPAAALLGPAHLFSTGLRYPPMTFVQPLSPPFMGFPITHVLTVSQCSRETVRTSPVTK